VGVISDIQRFSTGDGPGIRTTVFLKGCNLYCSWCHNPETIRPESQLLYYEKLCSDCRVCEQVCKFGAHKFQGEVHYFDRQLCTGCYECVQYCGTCALRKCGIEKSSAEVVAEILMDIKFYEASGGGVTLSGGEPLLQPQFCADILRECKQRDIHTIVDTAGNIGFSAFEKVIDYTDVFYFDLKTTDEQMYKSYTGAELNRVLSNLQTLCSSNHEVVVRIPVIPGFNDTGDAAEKLSELIEKAGAANVSLLPFHRLGTAKYEALGLNYAYSQTGGSSREKMPELLDVFQRKGLNAVVDG
jgi:glycyl-radical enzyme activating protein